MFSINHSGVWGTRCCCAAGMRPGHYLVQALCRGLAPDSTFSFPVSVSHWKQRRSAPCWCTWVSSFHRGPALIEEFLSSSLNDWPCALSFQFITFLLRSFPRLQLSWWLHLSPCRRASVFVPPADFTNTFYDKVINDNTNSNFLLTSNTFSSSLWLVFPFPSDCGTGWPVVPSLLPLNHLLGPFFEFSLVTSSEVNILCFPPCIRVPQYLW